jgi:hypothetical protein
MPHIPTLVQPQRTCGILLTPSGLMYHPHIRPFSTLPAFALSLSAGLADRLSLPNPFASKSLLGGMADSLRTHPIHVDHVAEAVLRCIADEDKRGVVDIEEMRRWAGFWMKEASKETAHV